MRVARISVDQRQWQSALDSARAALSLESHAAGAWYVLGRAHKELGNPDVSLACYRRALASDPANPGVLTSLGTALFELGQRVRALHAYRAALQARPDHAGARACLDHLEGPLPGGSARLRQLRDEAQRLSRLGRPAEALARTLEATRIAPTAAGVWLSAGLLAQETGDRVASLAYFEEAQRHDPALFPAVEAARRICINAGLLDKAIRYTERARALRPSDDLSIALALTICAIQPSIEALAESRRAYEAGLDSAAAAHLSISSLDAAQGMRGFFLAYQGENDRTLQMKAAKLFADAAPSLCMTAPHCKSPVARRGKVRIGFVSAFFYDHSIGKTSRGLIDRLCRDTFEVIVLRINPSKRDAVTDAVGRAADRMIELNPGLETARAQLAELELDILFYQDIGMEPQSYLLAFSRLAPVQCVSYGHPNTTGIPAIDYFISNDLYEMEGADGHYSERLFLLENLPTLAYYYRPAAPAGAAREFFGLSAADHVYLCPQTPFKIHPEFDAILRGILSRDPAGIVVLIRLEYEEYIEQLQQRFARTLGDTMNRVLFLDPMRFERFQQLLAVADVCLDTLHFNGMNSSLEALSVGTPIVTLPGRLQRGRHTQAMYRKMGITECIAKDPADYIDIATRLATDRDFAHSIRQRILASNAVLYEDARVVREFERFFLHAHREAQTRSD
jgi:predicted O-linked N-acetylglucosamine transferase (SPINDLY family)